MGIANRVINILVLVVAIAAAVFGVMLFNKREDVAKGRELMAKSIADSAAKLIAGETVAEKKKYAVSPEDMAISKTSQQLATPLKRLDDAVKHSLDQREKMAKDIVKIADLVNEGESGISDRRLNEYAQNAAEMEQVMQKIGARVELFSKFRVTMIDILQNANNKLKMDELDSSKTDKKNPDMDYVQKRFGDISDKGENALNRSDAYGKSLVKIATMFELESPELSGDDYETKLQEEMVGLKTYVEGHQALVREKEDLEAKNKELEGTKEKLLTENEEAQKTIETQKKSLELKEKKAQIDAAKIAKLEEALNVFNKSNDKKKKDLAKRNASGTVEEEVSNEVSNTTLLKQVLGKVVYADPSQNFVVIDLGKKYEIKVKDEKGALKPVKVQFPPDAVLTVASSMDPATAKFHGKIQIFDVRDNQSFANVLLSPNLQETPQVGDYVYFTNGDLDMISEINAKRLADIEAKAKASAPVTPKAVKKEETADDLLGAKEIKSEQKDDSVDSLLDEEDSSAAKPKETKSRKIDSLDDDVL